MSKQHRHCCWLVLKTMYLQFVWVNSLMVIKDNVNLYAGRDSSWKWIMFWRWYWCSSVLFLAKWRKLLNNSWYRGISFLLLELIQSMLGLFLSIFPEGVYLFEIYSSQKLYFFPILLIEAQSRWSVPNMRVLKGNRKRSAFYSLSSSQRKYLLSAWIWR